MTAGVAGLTGAFVTLGGSGAAPAAGERRQVVARLATVTSSSPSAAPAARALRGSDPAGSGTSTTTSTESSRSPAAGGQPPVGGRASRNPSVAQLLAGLGPIPSGWASAAHTVESGGLARRYITVAPKTLVSPVPVVVLLHGRNMTPGALLRASGLAGRLGPAVLVLPVGWEESWNAGDCCGLAFQHRIDDVGFMRTVVHDVLAAYPLADRSRIYALGFSNGGRLAFQLACQLPGTFDGFLAAEAVPVESCPSMDPIDVTIVAQQADPLLTIDSGRPKFVGGFVEPYVDVSVARAVSLDHCSSAYTEAVYGSAVEKTWSCADGTDVRYVLYPGGAHSWRPSSGSTPGATTFALQLMGRRPLVAAGPAAGFLAGHRATAYPSHSGA